MATRPKHSDQVTTRPAQQALQERDERSITVASAAARLGCDGTTIRALLRSGLLSGVRIGKTDKPGGVRVKLWSVTAWETRHAIAGQPTNVPTASPKPKTYRGPAHNPAHDVAVARLKAWGL
jgi:hypothetical protein